MTSHLTKDHPTDDSKEQWMEVDARLTKEHIYIYI